MTDDKKQIPLAEATIEQLTEFATLTLGLAVKARTPAHIIRTMIGKAYDKDHITLLDKPPEQAPAKKKADASSGPRKMVRIIVQTKDEEGGDEPIFVRVNTKGMWIPRGEVVEVPEAYAEALEHAVMWIYPESKIDPRTGDIGGLGEPRAVYTYPFQRVA